MIESGFFSRETSQLSLPPMNLNEPARQLPIQEDSDTLIAGGGPAGVAAAIASARAGARTTLIEVGSCLGGVWTSGLLSYILDPQGKTGLLPEIIERLDSLHAEASSRDQSSPEPWTQGAVMYDAELMKIAIEGLCEEAGVRIRLHTRVVAVVLDGSRITHVITESKSGREAWPAAQFIDCTGDGDLSALAGCTWEYGRSSDAKGQPLTMMCLLGGVSMEAIRPYLFGGPGAKWDQPIKAFAAELDRAGFSPSYSAPMLIPIHDGLYALMANHEYGASGFDADGVSRATLHARRELYHLVSALNKLGGHWTSLRLVTTAAQIAVRESRRPRGVYRVTREDVIAGRKHDDAVCRVTFPVDVHSLDPKEGKGFDNQGVKSQPYDVPFRALISAERENLLFAGRCISGDFVAHASYRVTGNAVPMGEAAGREAAKRVLESRNKDGSP